MCYLMLIKLYSEGPEAEDDDYEVDGVSEEHKDVNISDSTVLWLDKSSKKLKDWMVERPTPNSERERERERERGIMVSLKSNTKVIIKKMKRRASLDIC